MNIHAGRDLGLTASAGEELHAFASRLYPICRSLTGEGVRQTLGMISQAVPLSLTEIATGTDVFDWAIPREWNIRDAYIKNSQGERVVDFKRSNLHVLGYSTPVNRRMTLAELRPHLHTLPGQPDLIPYRTSYYRDDWGFCLSHAQAQSLPDGTYDVVIDSELRDGNLVYGEYLHQGDSSDEVLLSAHACHPSLANDNCSGLAVLARLAASLKGRSTRLSYRFLFAPGTIGAIAWLSRNETNVHRIKHGLVVAGVGDPGRATYKRSRRGDAKIDRVLEHVLAQPAFDGNIIDFSPYGYDERQYGSPGFNLPVGLLQRSPFGTFPEYHTSADNLDFITPAALQNSYEILQSAIGILERDRVLLNLSPKCEPQLGKRNAYAAIGGANAEQSRMALLWVLNQSDGTQSLFDIATRAKLPFEAICGAAAQLEEIGLVRTAGPQDKIAT